MPKSSTGLMCIIQQCSKHRQSRSVRPYSICRIWIQIHSESGLGFTGKSNSLDSWVLSELTSLLFVYVCDTDVTSGFASESTSKLDLLDSGIRIWICALNGRIH